MSDRPTLPEAFPDPVVTTQAANILAEIGNRFNELRKENMAAAWRWKLEAYSAHQSELVPAVMAAENFEKLLMSMEEFCKGSARPGKSPNEYLANWLNGDDSANDQFPESAPPTESVQ